jgi:hypothetical protein
LDMTNMHVMHLTGLTKSNRRRCYSKTGKEEN